MDRLAAELFFWRDWMFTASLYLLLQHLLLILSFRLFTLPIRRKNV